MRVNTKKFFFYLFCDDETVLFIEMKYFIWKILLWKSFFREKLAVVDSQLFRYEYSQYSLQKAAHSGAAQSPRYQEAQRINHDPYGVFPVVCPFYLV